MRVFGFLFLFLLISNLGFTQSAEITCPPNGSRKIDKVFRISSSPQKVLPTQIDSTAQDSTKSAKNKIANRLIVSLPNTNAIYLGYDNLVRIGFKDKKDKLFDLECDGCDTLFRLKKKSKYEWVIRANTAGKIVLRAINKKGKALSETVIPVLPLPFPTVHIDKVDAQAVLSSLPHRIRLIYDETVPLSVYFLVKSWDASIGNQSFKGNSNSTSQELRDLMQSKKQGTLILTIQFADPSGDREIKEIFEFDLD